MLQHFVESNNLNKSLIDTDESTRANQELKIFWERHVADNPHKTAAFAGVLRELRPAITGDESLLEWYVHAVKPVITGTGYRKTAVEDAQEFLASVMIYDEEEPNAVGRARTSNRICQDLLTAYLVRTQGLTEEDAFVAPDNAQVAGQIETVMTNFGRKMPKQFFTAINGLVISPDTRIQGLTLLSSFLRNQAPHLYRVLETPLVENLLKCLMNDTSTTVLSVALTSLIMLLPHIPGSLGTHLPRLFLIYSRLLCWEKFSPLSTESQRNLVTDDRISIDPEDDHDDVGIDPSWQKVRPKQGLVEATTPEVMTYFTYLYGLYPLNFMSYIRKPRKYLKSIDFPGADDFDLDQAVIRGRSDQFRQVHLLHPNFYNFTIEEELADSKWPRMDPADVVAECHGLCVNPRPTLLSPGPPPSGKLPDIPPVPPLPGNPMGSLSPAMSHTSLRSGTSWKDTATAVSVNPESPILGPRNGTPDDDGHNSDAYRMRSRSNASINKGSPIMDEFPPVPGARKEAPPPTTNLGYLQREITLLRNDLNFERWHKAQYSQHIGQLMRKNVKDATAEAETLNLINANRALKQQLDQVRVAREATLKDSALTRKQVNNLETNMTERFNKLKKEQETWTADAEELRRLRAEMKTYRDLQSAAESRELSQTHQLEIMKRDMESFERLNTDLLEAQRKIRLFQFREFDFEQAKRDVELLNGEKDTLILRLQRHEQDRERMRKVHAERVAEFEAQLNAHSPSNLHRTTSGFSDSSEQKAALAEAQSKLSQLKKAHARLLDKYTDLELEYSSAKSQLEALQGIDNQSVYKSISRVNSFVIPDRHNYVNDTMSGALDGGPLPPVSGPIGVLESVYDVQSEYGGGHGVALGGAAQEPTLAFASASTSDPTSRRYGSIAPTGLSSRDGPSQLPPHTLPASPPRSEATIHGSVGLTWKPPIMQSHSRGEVPTLTKVSSAHAARHDRYDSQASRDSSAAPLGYNKTAPLAADERSIAESRQSREDRKRERTEEKAKVKIQPQSEVRVYGRGKHLSQQTSLYILRQCETNSMV